MSAKKYDKRPGTSGIQGQLYETKLISLIYFRALHDDSVENFHLATNMDAIGAFDDICLRVKVSEFDKPLALFIQAKHRENDKLFTFSCNNDLAKYFDSYLRIKQLFNPANESPIFGGKFEDVECFFVMYTNARRPAEKENETEVKGVFADHLNKLIGTGDACVQPIYDNFQVDFVCKIVMKEEVTSLAQNIAKFITKKTNTELSMNNDVMLRYHVLLAQHVWDVSEIQTEGHRIVHFKENFFDSDEEFTVLFKNVLCLEVLKNKKTELNDVNSLLSKFFDCPDEVSLSKLIGNVITYNDKLEFIRKSTDNDLKRKLDKANVPETLVFKAAVIGTKEYLQTLKLKVPACFGNKDLTVRGSVDKKINQRLSHLTTEFVKILNNAETGKVITIDENDSSLSDGLLELNGGLASAVGNILVLDNDTGCLKFTDDIESLGSTARRWYEQLNSKIENLGEYKLDVKVKKFPKLTFSRGEHDVSVVRDFFNKLLLFTNQSNQSEVEDELKREIEDHVRYNLDVDVDNITVRSNLIYLTYIDEILKLWMVQGKTPYLTEDSKIYENAYTNAMNEPLIDVLNTMRKIKYKAIEFEEESLRVFEERDVIGAIIASETPELMTVKLEQYLDLLKKDHAVLELVQILKLSLPIDSTFFKENKTLIILSNYIQNFQSSKKKEKDAITKILQRINKAAEGKPIVIVADKPSVETIKNHFSQVNRIINDITISLVDLTDESRKKLLQTAKAKFQGLDVSLDEIIDGKSAELVDGTVMNNIIDGKTIEIGNNLTDDNYEKCKNIYIARTLEYTMKIRERTYQNERVMAQTLYDIPKDVVLITAIPGMGKSTLMTHLCEATKNTKVWIIRINLLEHTEILSYWKDRQIQINKIESLRFMCNIAIREKREDLNNVDKFEELQEELGTVVLKNWNGDSFTQFKLKLFLYYFKTQELIFIFDGFDEIYPHYPDQGLVLVKSVRDFPGKHKIWITTRSLTYSEEVLKMEFGIPCEIRELTLEEQQQFLYKYWDTKMQLTKLDRDQKQNINELINYFTKKYKTGFKSQQHIIVSNVYAMFLMYLKEQIADVNYSYSIPSGIIDYFKEARFAASTLERSSISSAAYITPTPLQLSLLAEHILNKIKDTDKKKNKWDINATNCSIYEIYIKSTLEIKYREKHKSDITNTFIKLAYNNEKEECLKKHKKLGFYALFYSHLEIIEETELKHMIKLVEQVRDEIKNGKEKIGFIRTVDNNIPLFVHKSFAEYFAVEFICDRIKKKLYDTEEKKKELFEFIKVMFAVTNCFIIFYGKYEKSLTRAEEEIKEEKERKEEPFFVILMRDHPSIYDLMCKIKSCFDKFVDNLSTDDTPRWNLLHKVQNLISGVP